MRGFLTLILIQCLHRSINKNIVAQENRKVNEIVILSLLSAYTLLSDDIILLHSHSVLILKFKFHSYGGSCARRKALLL